MADGKGEEAANAPPAAVESRLVANFKACRRVSVPIVAIETPDAASTITTLRGVLSKNTPVLVWDCATGLRGLGENGSPGREAFAKLGVDPNQMVNATEAMIAIQGLPSMSVVFLHNFHRQLEQISALQAVWNLRDVFKVNGRMVVMLGPSFQLPAELAGDVVVLEEPLPTRGELSMTLDQQHKNANLPLPPDDKRIAALDAGVGLPQFTAEQVFAMSLTTKGIDVPKLWERKVKAIENTDGLRVWKGREGDTTLDELRGIDNVVAFVTMLIEADAFGAIVFIDEMDKAFAGGMSEHTGDSGVSKDQVGTVLSYIEDTGSLGLLLAGVAGTGKTQLVKAMGVRSGKPVIVFDLGGMKGGTVGQSERQIRNALKVVSATAEGRVLFAGSANRTTLFTPELNRRFPDQFFYDIPDDSGRKAIWPVYVKKNGLTASQAKFPKGFDRGWTGAEIKRTCERAALFGKTVIDAARHIVPSAVSARGPIRRLREEAAGRFLSASYDGTYKVPDEESDEPALPKQRAIEIG